MEQHLPSFGYFLWGSGPEGGPFAGLVVNLQMTGVALLLGVLAGIPLGVFRGLAPFWVHAPVSGVLALVRATPLLLLVLWLYLLIQAVMAIHLAPVWIGCLALALYAATNVSDIVRAGTRAVKPGQLRAARSLGLNRLQIARHVVVPVAVRVMAPALTSFATALFKDSSVCYVIGVVELMQLGVFTATRQPRMLLEVYGLVALLFFAVSVTGTRFADRLERRARMRGMVAGGGS